MPCNKTGSFFSGLGGFLCSGVCRLPGFSGCFASVFHILSVIMFDLLFLQEPGERVGGKAWVLRQGLVILAIHIGFMECPFRFGSLPVGFQTVVAESGLCHAGTFGKSTLTGPLDTMPSLHTGIFFFHFMDFAVGFAGYHAACQGSRTGNRVCLFDFRHGLFHFLKPEFRFAFAFCLIIESFTSQLFLLWDTLPGCLCFICRLFRFADIAVQFRHGTIFLGKMKPPGKIRLLFFAADIFAFARGLVFFDCTLTGDLLGHLVTGLILFHVPSPPRYNVLYTCRSVSPP